MEISPVQIFVRENVSKFQHSVNSRFHHQYNLYNSCNSHIGDYTVYKTLFGEQFFSNTRILGNDLNPLMQEYVLHRKDDYVFIGDETKNQGFYKIPRIITNIITFVDFENDKFVTTKKQSILKNELTEAVDFEKPSGYEGVTFYQKQELCYEKTTETIREGSVSETRNDVRSGITTSGNFIGYPYVLF